LAVEQEMIMQKLPQRREELIRRIDEIDAEVNKIKVPASYGDQFYILRGHIGFVRQKL
ncbi:MAG: hypothetical protein H6Q43_1404, partial [Deltaproteobacteria bacterium]|nr:hypothetical protein [Deltaproteobacteria bacterium]